MTLLILGLALLPPLLSACSPGESAYATDEDFCQAVFASLGQPDAATMAGLLLTAEALPVIADQLETSTDKQRSIKEEFLTFDAAEIAEAARTMVARLEAQATEDGLVLSEGKYRGIVQSRPRFEVPNLSCRTLWFAIDFPERFYVVRLDIMESPQGRFVYEPRFKTYATVSVSFTQPAGNSVEGVAGQNLPYELDFDTEKANSQGAWIEIQFDGEPAGMIAGTSLESPLKREVPGPSLTPGKHTLAVRIHPAGQATGYPLGEASLEIAVP